MALISTIQRNKLLKQVKVSLGYPMRKFELNEEMLDTLIEMAVEDYSAYVNEWLVEQQWVGLQGVEIEDTDFFNAFTTKSNDFMRSFTYAYSKQVGMGTNAPAAAGWELKRDFITTSANTQHYIIPAGREVNEVLWETPPSIDKGIVDPFALSNWQAGGMGWGYMGRPAMYVQPTFSTLLASQDRRTKERILQSELTYRITGIETGEKLLHLYPVPGTRNEIRGRWGKHYAGRKVWYFYYDTTEREKCMADNKDVVKLPSDVPLDVLDFDNLNATARQQVRDLLIAHAKITIGGIRGFFTGEVGATEKQLTMDYRHLLDEGQTLKTETRDKILDSLNKISLVQLTADRASIAENVNKERGYQPPQFPIMTY